ncbi:MAG: hypothetical protein FWD65_07275 [Coriobacteriia bacterium]|nr:hypothetical protein [Coriobacteriia bacterium]
MLYAIHWIGLQRLHAVLWVSRLLEALTVESLSSFLTQTLALLVACALIGLILTCVGLKLYRIVSCLVGAAMLGYLGWQLGAAINPVSLLSAALWALLFAIIGAFLFYFLNVISMGLGAFVVCFAVLHQWTGLALWVIAAVSLACAVLFCVLLIKRHFLRTPLEGGVVLGLVMLHFSGYLEALGVAVVCALSGIILQRFLAPKLQHKKRSKMDSRASAPTPPTQEAMTAEAQADAEEAEIRNYICKLSRAHAGQFSQGTVVTNIEELRKKYRSDNFVAFSADIDWASEDCIKELLDFFEINQIPLTLFCTHPSKLLSGHSADPMIELGIHPNYCSDSSQGRTMDEVTDYCMNLVPGARCVRGHRWFTSNDMYDRLVARGIRYDSSECSMLDLVEPHIHRSGMLRLPVFLEDGGLLQSGAEPDFVTCGKKYFAGNGLKVIDLHPIHFAINSPTLDYYRQVADEHSRADYMAMGWEEIEHLCYKGKGMRDYVAELVEYIRSKHIQVVTMGQIYDELTYEDEVRHAA